MSSKSSITVSAPCKVHLLGEHSVVYGKPALLAALDLRVTVTISKGHPTPHPLRKIIEPIVKKELKIKTIPPYQLTISSQIPIGSGLGSSAAVSAAYIAALLSFLKVKWDLDLVNKLAYEAEKVFHGNPSGGDNSTVIYGGLVWFRKESPDLKIIQPLNFTIPPKIAKNFVLINTGTPSETTADMVKMVRQLYNATRYKKRSDYVEKPQVVERFLQSQESLVRELIPVIKEGKEDELIRILRDGGKNLESIGVVSNYVKSIIRKIEKLGGAAKICGGGGKTKGTGVLLCYHPNVSVIEKIAQINNLPFFKTTLGVEGLRREM